MILVFKIFPGMLGKVYSPGENFKRIVPLKKMLHKLGTGKKNSNTYYIHSRSSVTLIQFRPQSPTYTYIPSERHKITSLFLY